jgi:anti-sigma B factor antagonist
MLEIEELDGWRRIRIRGDLILNRVRDIHREIRSSLEDHPRVVIDLSEVDDFDTAGVQLLIALKKEFVTTDRTLRLVGHSPVVLEYFALYGLVAFFGDRIVLKKGEKRKYGFEYGLKREAESA